MSELRRGYIYAAGAYFLWGFFPIYWHLLHSVPSAEILAHRIIWSFFFYYFILRVSKIGNLAVIWRSKKLRQLLAVSATLISINWLIYIYAVNSGHVLESSLGYFVSPLVNIFLGFIVLKERLSPIRWLSVFLAVVGVTILAFNSPTFPWIAISLALTFGFYGLVRKICKAEAVKASTVETFYLLPFAVLFLVFFHSPSSRWMGLISADSTMGLLALGGVITGVPLLWFAEAAQRIPLTSMGFFQYIAPILQFLIAVLFFKESFFLIHAISFGFIWLALLLYSVELIRKK